MRIGKYIYTKNNLTLYTNPDFNSVDQPLGELSTERKHNVFQDISYQKLSRLADHPVPAGVIYVCELLDKTAYPALEYVELTQSLDTIAMSMEVNFRISEWRAQMSLLAFVDAMRKRLGEQCGVDSQQENLFDEDLVHIQFKLRVAAGKNLADVIQRFSRKLQKVHSNILIKHAEERLSLLGS